MPVLVPEPHDPVCFRKDGKRLDGRDVDEPRPFSCEVGVIKNAQGSAVVRHGGNLIYAAVYGPREVHPRHLAKPDRGILRVYYRMATFSVHDRKSPAPNRRDNEISKVIREAIEPVLFLEAYPDSQIEVFIQIMAADGGTRCASTTAASLALADAGIPMRSMIVGIAAGKAQDKVILDLGDKEDKVGQADIPAVVVMKDKTISLLQFDGEMSIEEMKLAFKYILKGAEVIYQKQLEALKGKYEKIQAKAQKESVEYQKTVVKSSKDKELSPADTSVSEKAEKAEETKTAKKPKEDEKVQKPKKDLKKETKKGTTRKSIKKESKKVSKKKIDDKSPKDKGTIEDAPKKEDEKGGKTK